jgi:hypothetical protein
LCWHLVKQGSTVNATAHTIGHVMVNCMT